MILEATQELTRENIARITQLLRTLIPDIELKQARVIAALCNAQGKGFISLISSSDDPDFRVQATSEMKRALFYYLESVIKPGGGK